MANGSGRAAGLHPECFHKVWAAAGPCAHVTSWMLQLAACSLTLTPIPPWKKHFEQCTIGTTGFEDMDAGQT